MIVYKSKFGQLNGPASDLAHESVRFTAITPLTEVEEELESWADDNYMEIVDTTEFLDSSRVKRID